MKFVKSPQKELPSNMKPFLAKKETRVEQDDV